MTARSVRRAAERKANKAALKTERNLALETPPPPIAAEPLSWLSEPLVRPQPNGRELLHETLCWRHEPSENATTEPLLFTPSPFSADHAAASHANASLNAGEAAAILSQPKIQMITALTGRTVLLPNNDAPEYERHLRAYADHFLPVGARESDLVQSISDIAWRLKRIPCLESAIFAQGHIEFAEAFKPARRPAPCRHD